MTSDGAADRIADRRPRPIATSGGLVFDDAGRCLLIRTYKWSNLWGTPGGKIEYGESMAAAFAREVREETALEVVDVQCVGVLEAIEHPEFVEPRHFILLQFIGRLRGSPAVTLNDEAHDWRWVTPAEARAMPLNAPTRDLLDLLERRPATMTETAT